MYLIATGLLLTVFFLACLIRTGVIDGFMFKNYYSLLTKPLILFCFVYLEPITCLYIEIRSKFSADIYRTVSKANLSSCFSLAIR